MKISCNALQEVYHLMVIVIMMIITYGSSYYIQMASPSSRECGKEEHFKGNVNNFNVNNINYELNARVCIIKYRRRRQRGVAERCKLFSS